MIPDPEPVRSLELVAIEDDDRNDGKDEERGVEQERRNGGLDPGRTEERGPMESRGDGLRRLR